MALKMELMEAAVAALKAYFETNMAAKLGELAGEVDLPEPTYHTAEVGTPPEFPCVFILGENTDLPPSLQRQYSVWAKHLITLVVLATDDDPELLRTKLYRYTRALAELVNEAQYSTGWTHTNFVTDIRYSSVNQVDQAFMADAQVVVTLENEESTLY